MKQPSHRWTREDAQTKGAWVTLTTHDPKRVITPVVGCTPYTYLDPLRIPFSSWLRIEVEARPRLDPSDKLMQIRGQFSNRT